MNPAITVNVEVANLSMEYFVHTYATIRLTIKRTEPESSGFLLRYGAGIFRVKFCKVISHYTTRFAFH
jgi:hypothetical protein